MALRFLSFIRNRQTWGFLVSVAVMAVIALAFFYPDNFEGNDLRQHDMVQGLANSHELAQHSAETGQQAYWTNSLFSGMPAYQIQPEYPSDHLFKWVTKVYGLGLPAPSNILFMMMLGFMILMMTMRVRWEYGLIGAIAWGFSTYFIIIIGAGHIWKFVTLAYIPPTIAGLILTYRHRYIGGAALTAFFMMMQVSANHVQMTYYFTFVILGLVIAFLCRAVATKQFKKWLVASAVALGAMGLGIGANLPNLYHTWRYAKETMRGASELAEGPSDTGSGLSRDYITQYSYGVAETFTLLIPNVKGGATVKINNGRTELAPLSDLDGARSYLDPVNRQILPKLPQYFGEPEMTNGPVYVGAIIFALFIVGCIVVRGPLKWALLALTLLSIGLAWGRNFMTLTDIFISLVPMYAKFRTVESILVIAEFTIPLLAILGLNQLMTQGRERPRLNLTALYTGFGTVAFFALLGIIKPGIYGLNDAITEGQLTDYPEALNATLSLRASMVRADALRTLLFAAIGFVPLWLYLSGKIKRHRTAVITVTTVTGLAVLADMYGVDKRYISSDSFYHPPFAERYAPQEPITPTAVDLAILQDTDPNYRVADYDRFGSAEPSYFHKMVGGYHAAKLSRYQDLIERHIGRPSSEQDLTILGMLNTRYLVQGGQVFQLPEALGNAWFVDRLVYVDGARAEMEALDYLRPATEAVADGQFRDILGDVTPADSTSVITETSYSPDRLTYVSDSPSGGLAVFSEVYFPWGWEATVDGQPAQIARVNYLLRAIKIPAGHHEIVMTYAPQSVRTTSNVATACIVAVYLLCAVALVTALSKRKDEADA